MYQNEITMISLMFLNLFLIDYIAVFLSNLINQKIKHHNTRWFFIHTYVNLCTTYFSLPSFNYSLNNIGTAYLTKWDNNSYITFWFALVGHVYHMIFFYKKLKNAEWMHHIIMCLICGPLTYYIQSILSTVALLFLCGIPGLIDYFLLWLVKLKMVDTKFEKKMYVLVFCSH